MASSALLDEGMPFDVLPVAPPVAARTREAALMTDGLRVAEEPFSFWTG